MINVFLKFYVFFLIGAYCGNWCIRKIENYRTITVVLSGFTLIIGNIGRYAYGLPNTRLYSFVLTLMGSLFVVTVSQMVKQSNILTYIGRNSLPI